MSVRVGRAVRVGVGATVATTVGDGVGEDAAKVAVGVAVTIGVAVGLGRLTSGCSRPVRPSVTSAVVITATTTAAVPARRAVRIGTMPKSVGPRSVGAVSGPERHRAVHGQLGQSADTAVQPYQLSLYAAA